MAIRPLKREETVDGVDRRGAAFTGARQRQEEAPRALPIAPECPFCGGSDTEIMNSFGSHASLSTYWCLACGTPFEFMKWRS